MNTTDHIVAVIFDDQSKAYHALSILRDADAAGRISVNQALVVERLPDGSIHIPENVDAVGGQPTVTGGLLGTAVGVLGGPLGVLLGFGIGSVVGSIADGKRLELGTTSIGVMSSWIAPGNTVLIADVTELAVEVIDSEMAKLDGTVYRQDTDEVVAELESIQEAAKVAEKEADRVIKEEKKRRRQERFEQTIADHKENRDRRIAALKEKWASVGR